MFVFKVWLKLFGGRVEKSRQVSKLINISAFFDFMFGTSN